MTEEFSKMEAEREALLIEEDKISKNVLKIMDPKLYNLTPFVTKQQEFRDTCLAIQNIVNLKMYRCISGSLEAYFKKRWSVSRAQTYRLFECASILKLLDGMTIIPHKERICRQLKNSAGLSEQNVRLLWSQVIEKTGGLESQINSFNIEDYWLKNFGPKFHNTSQDSKKIRSTKKKTGTKKERLETSETEYSDGSEDYAPKRLEPIVEPIEKVEEPTTVYDPNGNLLNKIRRNTRSALHSRQNSLESDVDSSDSYQTFTSKRKRKSSIYDCASKIERDWLACQESMRTLAELGYRIEPKIGNEWVQPEMFRLYGPGHDQTDTDEPKSSTLDHLVMAAEWAYTGHF